jgi:dihydrofolate reductase
VRISAIVAADEKDTIGNNGELPWHLPEDLKRFKRLTLGHVVVVGRVTQDSIVDRLGGPLPGRVTVVVTRRGGIRDLPDLLHRTELTSALATAWEIEQSNGRDEVFLLGGADIYRQGMNLVQTVYLTRVHTTVEGDRGMPEGWLAGFTLVEREPRDGYTFETYERLPAP